MVRKGGVVNFFGGPPSGTVVALDTNRLHYGDITLKASFHHTPGTARRAFELIRGGRFKCSETITGHARLADLDGVLRGLMNRSRQDGVGDIKTAIIP
jgi:L-iditol 2-dehydrogenase